MSRAWKIDEKRQPRPQGSFRRQKEIRKTGRGWKPWGPRGTSLEKKERNPGDEIGKKSFSVDFSLQSYVWSLNVWNGLLSWNGMVYIVLSLGSGYIADWNFRNPGVFNRIQSKTNRTKDTLMARTVKHQTNTHTKKRLKVKSQIAYNTPVSVPR